MRAIQRRANKEKNSGKSALTSKGGWRNVRLRGMLIIAWPRMSHEQKKDQQRISPRAFILCGLAHSSRRLLSIILIEAQTEALIPLPFLVPEIRA